MAYEAKPGSFNLFKNTGKKEDKHPDYKGEGKDLDGNAISIGAWLNDGAKGKFMKCKIELKEDKPIVTAEKKQDVAAEKKQEFSDFDQDIPFN